MSTRRHWIIFVNGWAWVGWLLALALFPVGLLLPLWVLVDWWVDKTELDGSLLRHQDGVFTTNEWMSPIKKIEAITITQTFLGRILGYCTVVVETTGGRGIEIRWMPNVKFWRDLASGLE